MFKYAVPFVFLFSVISVAQQSPNKTPATSDPKSSAQASASTESAGALSKDYRKSAIVAVSSIDDWRKKALELSHSTSFSDGSVYASRSSTEREADAGEKAEKDVKTAKVDTTTPGRQVSPGAA